MDNTKMPDRVFLSAEAITDFTVNDATECYRERDDYFPTEYLKADLVPQWIKYSERLPEENRVVMVYCAERKNTYMVSRSGSLNGVPRWYYWGVYGREMHEPVTHWQPLPTQPTEE